MIKPYCTGPILSSALFPERLIDFTITSLGITPLPTSQKTAVYANGTGNE